MELRFPSSPLVLSPISQSDNAQSCVRLEREDHSEASKQVKSCLKRSNRGRGHVNLAESTPRLMVRWQCAAWLDVV